MISSVRWTSHLKTQEDKDKFIRKVTSSRSVLKRLSEIAQEDYDTSLRSMKDKKNFELPAWSEKQAYELGKQKALDTIIELTKV